MNRRRFTRLSVAGLVGLGLGDPRGRPRPPGPGGTRRTGGDVGLRPLQDLRVDGERLNARLAELSRFGRNEAGGVDRVAFSDADLEARAWMRELMERAALETRVDLAGNLWGRAAGTDPSLPPLVAGSHTDSVPGGGNYDGPVGSMAALEAAATLADAGHRTRHPLEVVIFANEEGGKTGSRALIGAVEPMELGLETASGFTIGEGLRRLGGDPDRLDDALLRPGVFEAFFELHVEQGAVLERQGVDIGVVQGIVGIRRWAVTVEGFTNHAGTTPMDQRTDALVAAARFVDAVYRSARSTPGSHVATVGRLDVEPGAPNVVPGRVTLSLEIRDLSMETIDELFAAFRGRARRIADETGASFSFEPFYLSEAAPTDPRLRDVVEEEAERLGHSTLRMPSGAGHDAQSMAKLGPVGMIFVPSRAGVSHAPLEHTPAEDVTAGADVLLRSLLAVDRSGLE